MAQTRLKLVTLVSVIITASVQADVIGVRLNNNGRCLITDTQYVLGQVSSAHPNAESRVGCPAGTIATSCQCDATLNGCKSAWFYENNQCVALNHGRNHIGTMANVTCVEFTCDNNYRVQMETFESHDVGYPSVQCPSWMKRIGCYVRISSKLGTTIYGQGKIKGNTCQCGPSTDNEETCSAFVQCQAVYKNEFTDVAIEERCVDYITISWSMEGDPTNVPGYAITIDPATVEGQNSIPLQGEELLNELYDPSTGRMVYTIASLEAGLLYRICVNLLDSSCGVTDRISLLSDDICQQKGNPCENGGTCCDDGEGYVCHCTEKYRGSNCEDQINPCDPNPCQNGGMCVLREDGFDCSCPVGYDGDICEELVLVPVDSDTIEVIALCTSASIRWQESGVGLAPERYEVEGSQLSGSERHVLCASEHPVTSCEATDLERKATYLFGVVSIAGTERAESDVESFTLADNPSYTTCPSDLEPVYADGVDEVRVWWEEPESECLGQSTVEASTHKPGDIFPIGITAVVYRLIDSAVEVDTCEFNVVVEERGVCTAYGDPHYMSFNNEYYSFQGVCTYTLASSSDSVSPKFNVTVQNEEAETNPSYSTTKEVTVYLFDTVISLMEDGEVRIDGIRVRLPANPVSNVFVVRNGMVVSLHTDFGFYVSFDGKHQVVVKAPADPYKYHVGGLCDHYGKAGSMYVMPGGEETEDVNEFGHSWATEQCDIPTTTPCTPSDGNHKCDIIIDDQGPFKGCHDIDEPDSYYQSCLTDYCAIGDYCSAIEAYQRRCRDLGLPVQEWRDEDICPVVCAEGKEYSSCGPPCTNTCVKPDASENCPITDCMEGCFCPDGTVLDGDECIEPADCGCTRDGRYFSIGDVIMDPLCENICNCTEDREMVCTPMQCDENASCEIHDGIRQCVCNEDCDGNGFSFNGRWGESSACKQECYDPGTPRFGYQDKRYEYPVCSGTLVSFKCTPGYAQIGSPSVTCKDGVWDPIPECESICCDPGTPDNGYQEDSYDYPVLDDSTVYFHCNDGYALHDALTEECLHNASTTCMNGEWSDPLPQCRLKCNDPGNPDNGEQVEEPDYPVCSGTIVTFSCHDGYTLVGSETTMCQDGEWVGQLPICEAHCEDPGTPSNGCQLEDYEYPAYSDYVVYFCCNDGYALHDIQTKECLHNASTTCEDGQWSDPLPECRLKCDYPGSPENGELVEEIDSPVCTGTDVTFRCTDGYTLVGKNTITCQDGDWSDPIPVCKAPCEDPGTPQDGYQRDDHEYPVHHDSVVFFCCDDGYTLHDKLTKECLQNSSTTCVDGEWSDPLPECLPHCEDPGSLENGEIEDDIEFPVCSGTNVTFSCHDGYTLIGPDTTTCQDGEWTHQVPTCTAHCEDPGTPENGHQMENYEYPVLDDFVVYFGCDDGYGLHDYYTKECLKNASTTCSNGDWSDPLPECRLKCDDPGSPQNGQLVDKIDFPVCTGTDVTFRCTDGYTLVGKNTITCQDGNWSDPIPVCKAPCEDPGTPRDGYQRDDHEYPVHHDSVVFFCCDDGYALHDELSKECLQNSSTTCVDGEWSDPLPECLPHCEDPGSLENGEIEDDIEFPVCSGTNITFSCHDGYTLIGTSKTSCQNGEWTHPVPFCEPHCEDPGTPENGYQDGNYEYPVPDETVVKFSCNYGYGLKDPETEACVETYESICDDREWSNSLPLCVRECAEPGQTSAGNVKIYHIVTYMTMLVLVYMSYFSVQ